jgi:hypothetical protein
MSLQMKQVFVGPALKAVSGGRDTAALEEALDR